MKLPSKRRALLIAIAVLLALFLIRPGAARLKTRIATSIGTALQRQVEIDTVHLHLLPRPGFDLDGFVVHDDPKFGAEPVLRAQEVTAQLRLTSLLRGRLEISRLSLAEPSLNLVRRDDGRWNIENFLERTARITIVSATPNSSAQHPAFPYIEADRGRINFKFGPEKKPFAITDAKYSFWQDSPNRWGMRLRGQPVRADMSLSDTGELRVNGNWQRAESLYDIPVDFSLQWDGAQLGQMSKLVSGQDRGWRATVRATLNLRGTPANLLVRADGSLDDFRRYDIAGSIPVELKTHCEAQYKIADRGLHEILCQTPVGAGSVALSGEAVNLMGARRYDVHMKVEKLPMQAIANLVRRAKKDLPADLLAAGTLDASFHLAGQPAERVLLEGGGKTKDFRLQSETNKTDLLLDTVPFSIAPAAPLSASKEAAAHREAASLVRPDETHLFVGPVTLKLGRPSPAVLQAWVARSGYRLSIKGDSDIHRLMQAARIAGIPAPNPEASGLARVDLQVAGSWTGFAGPVATGTADLHTLKAEIRGIPDPIEISSARIDLREAETRIDAISASAAGTHWSGSLSLPRPCPVPCSIRFDLRADELSTTRLREYLNPNAPDRPWYRFQSAARKDGQSSLADLHASGILSADRVVLRDLILDRVTAKVDLDQSKLRLTDLRADLLGGKHRGRWLVDFTGKAPHYSGSGTLDSASLTQLAEFMKDSWVSGIASAKYQVEFTGLSTADLLSSAKGTLHFSMRDGSFPRILMSAAPLQVRRFTGTLTLLDGEFDLQQATLASPAANYAVTGKVMASRKLDFKLTPEGSAALTVTGTFADPRVAPLRRAQTQASLKP